MLKHLMKITLLVLSFAMIFPSFANAEGTKHAERQTQPMSANALKFKEDMRRLWFEHAIWTGRLIVSAEEGLEDYGAVLDRLLKNQDDIGNAIKPFYGDAAGNKLAQLLREHILIGGKVIAAAKSSNQAEFEKYNTQWFKNADDITDFLSSANPHFNKEELKESFYTHLKLVTDSVVLRLKKDWKGDIAAFDKNEAHIMNMADILTQGILKQFPNKF